MQPEQIPKLRPVGNRVLVLPVKESMGAGGIIIPENHVERNESCGIVLAIGERARCACQNKDCDALMPHVKVGDTVLFPRLEATKVNWRNRDYLLVPSHHVAMIMDTKKPDLC